MFRNDLKCGLFSFQGEARRTDVSCGVGLWSAWSYRKLASLGGSAPADARIEGIAQTVTEVVDAQHRERDQDAG